MTKSWNQWVAGCCLVAARVPVLAQKEGAFVIDGNDWMRASAVARRVFLVGAGIGRAAGNTATGALISLRGSAKWVSCEIGKSALRRAGRCRRHRQSAYAQPLPANHSPSGHDRIYQDFSAVQLWRWRHWFLRSHYGSLQKTRKHPCLLLEGDAA